MLNTIRCLSGSLSKAFWSLSCISSPESILASIQTEDLVAYLGEADLTTVYRREKHGPPPTQPSPQLTEATPARTGIGMILGVLAFALVGFAVAAAVIHYMQTGRMIWE